MRPTAPWNGLLAGLLLVGLAGASSVPAAEDSSAKPASDSASSATASPDFSGNWDVQIGEGKAASNVSMTLYKDGDAYKGSYTDPTGALTGVRGRMAAGKLVITVTSRSQSGQAITQTYALTPEGSDTLKGIFVDGSSNELPFVLHRAKSASSGKPSDPVGEWTLSVVSPQGTRESKVSLRRDGDKLVGDFQAANANPPTKTPLKEAVLNGNTLKLTLEVQRDGQTVTSEYIGTLEGDEYKGDVTSRFGTRHFTGKRAGASAFDPLGEWTVTTVAPDQTYTSTVTLKKDGDNTVGEFAMDTGAKSPLKDISIQGATVKFTTELNVGGDQPLHLAFIGNGSGEEIKGQVEAGTFGNLPFTAKRKGAPKPSLEALAGDWNVTIVNDKDNEKYFGTVALEVKDGKLAGTYTATDTEPKVSAPLQDLGLEGKNVKFAVELPIEVGGKPLHLVFNGTLEGDTIKGIEEAPQGLLPFTAMHVKKPVEPSKSAAGDLTGDWDFAIVTPNETFRPVVHMDQKGETLTGGMQGPTQDGNDLPFTEGTIKDGAIHFVFTIPINGKDVRFDYTGKRDGDKLAGDVKSELGTVPWSATRKASPTK
jgi:predicted ester cyclase